MIVSSANLILIQFFNEPFHREEFFRESIPFLNNITNSLEEIKKLIEYYFNCKVHFEYYKDKKAVDTCFYVSNRNLKLITKYIYPHILLPYKKLRLKKFINMKNEPVRI